MPSAVKCSELFLSAVLLSLLGLTSVLCVIDIPCSLVWKLQLTNEPLPEDAVATHPKEHFIGRLGHFFGRVENSTGVAHFAYEDDKKYKAVSFRIYEILTNPNDCALSWERTEEGGSIPEIQFAVLSGYSGGFVSRVKYENVELGALLKGEFYYLHTLDGEIKTNIAGGAKYLKSTINLRCELTNFDFGEEEVDSGDPDFLGLDTIINDADTIVTQTVVHNKTFIESYTFTESESFSEVNTWEVSVKIPITASVNVGIDFKYEDRKGNSQSETVGHTKEKEVTSSRTVVVPPNTAVEICSLVNLPNGPPLNYTARGRYYIKGKKAEEVRAILLQQKIKDIEIIGSRERSVLAHVPGKLEVSVPTKTRFIITSPGDPNGCKQIMGKIQELKVGVNMNKMSKQMAGELRKSITQMINANIKTVKI